MNHPVDSLGKLRIVDLEQNGTRTTIEFNYLSGLCLTTAIYELNDRFPLRMYHADENGTNKRFVEGLIVSEASEIQNFIKQYSGIKKPKTDFTVDQLFAMDCRKLRKLARKYKINIDCGDKRRAAYKIYDAQIDSKYN